MNLQQRQSSPNEEVDLEVTAELPVLDVATYEANVASAAAAVAADVIAANTAHAHDSGSTDTWHVPAAALRRAGSSQAANSALDENRARLEVNLQALSATLRDVEERLTRKGERLVEIEKALELAVAERNVTEQRARSLTEEVARAEAAVSVAQARIAELQKALQDHATAEAARQLRDAEAQAQLLDRNKQLQAQLASSDRDFEAQLAVRQREFDSRLATQALAVARLEQELRLTRERNTQYLEALQSNEGRRSVFEDLIARLEEDVEQRELRIRQLEGALSEHTAHATQLESELRERVVRIAELDGQLGAVSASLTQRTEQHTDAERTRASLQENVSSLSGTLAERNDRVKALEETVAQQTVEITQLREELERTSAERGQLLSGTVSLETAVKEATARGDQHETVAHAAQTRLDEYEATFVTQRSRIEQLETEVAAVRAQLQSTGTSLQAAAVERNEHVARIATGEAHTQELERRIAEQQESLRVLQAESNTAVARARELEGDLRATEETINRLETDVRGRSARVEELEKINTEWRVTVEEARHAIQDRDGLIERLEQETAASAVLVGHIQKSITRLDSDAPQGHEPAADGAARLLIRTDGDTEVVHVLGRKTTVGRTPDNDLQIDAKFISRHHAVILAGPAHAIIEDLNSTNGVMVNNRRIARQPLKDGDNVVIGKTSFRFAIRPTKTAATA